MDKTLMHWRAWGLLREFKHKFYGVPIAPEGLHPAELSRLMHRSLLSGEVAAPLTVTPPIERVNIAWPRHERALHPPRPAKMRAHLDRLRRPDADKRGKG